MPRLFKRKLPPFIKKRLLKKLDAFWSKVEAAMPAVELEKKHLQNLTAVDNREALLLLLPQNGIVALLGGDEGGFDKLILERTRPQQLHLIDQWEANEHSKSRREAMEREFKTQIREGQVTFHSGSPARVAQEFENAYFDWIYIDTDHSYPTTKAELEAFREKLKPGGIIAGHDFIIGNWKTITRYGVREAVYEFCVHFNWEFLYLTMENRGHPSFAIRRIGEG